MIMPMPRWRQNHVSPRHTNLLALHSRESARPLYDEAQGKRDVPVCRSCFARLDELEACVECVGGVGSVEGGVDELEDSAFGFRVGDEFAC